MADSWGIQVFEASIEETIGFGISIFLRYFLSSIPTVFCSYFPLLFFSFLVGFGHCRRGFHGFGMPLNLVLFLFSFFSWAEQPLVAKGLPMHCLGELCSRVAWASAAHACVAWVTHARVTWAACAWPGACCSWPGLLSCGPGTRCSRPG